MKLPAVNTAVKQLNELQFFHASGQWQVLASRKLQLNWLLCQLNVGRGSCTQGNLTAGRPPGGFQRPLTQRPQRGRSAEAPFAVTGFPRKGGARQICRP